MLPARAQQITNRVLGVVRNSKRVHEQVADFKARAGVEEMAVEFGLQLKFKRLLRGAVAINRDVQLGGNAGQSLNVVAVFMRDQDGGEVFRHPTDGGEALANLARAEPGVHEHAGFIGFDIGTVAAGTAAEDGEFNSHKWTLVSRKQRGKLFSTTEAWSKIQLCVFCGWDKFSSGRVLTFGAVCQGLLCEPKPVLLNNGMGCAFTVRTKHICSF